MTTPFRRAAALTLLGLLASSHLHAAEPPRIGADHARDMAAGLALFKGEQGKPGVRELLVENCLACHGGDATEAAFSLVDRHALLKGGESGPAVIPGKAGESRLIRLIAHAEEPAMPQDASKLSDEDIASIRNWIDLGAPFDAPLIEPDKPQESWTQRKVPPSARDFWAFRPLADAPPPAVDDPAWCVNDIDRFILAKQREKSLRPNPPAGRLTLIRRAYLDLIGLPPTPEEVDAFLADPSTDAYDHLVDCLLDDNRFGERWARHWLDVARFAESHGFEQDYDRPYAYHYRDFVIKAFNADLPYDTFVRWQLAGDEIAPNEPLAMAATGFLAAGVFPTQITANEVERTRYDALDDMAATTTQAFLGLTVGCARCHDHKFDPMPQADYYRFASIFTTTVRSNIDLPIYPQADTGTAVAAPKPVKTMIASEGVPAIRHHTQGGDFLDETYYLRRGDCDQKETVADPGFLQALSTHPDGESHWKQPPPPGSRTSYRRKALADWMIDTEHGPGHLLARVIVNRLWHHHFGRGLIATPSDFGVQGTPPTHPELLDHLANRLISGGWKLKPIHRLIVTSATYRQSSQLPTPNSQDLQNDPLTRFAPRRLEAEALRDSILAVSGRLDHTKYGPGSLEESHTRRSIYFTIKRSRLIPTLTLFDVPEPNVSVGNRQSTTIAPQALHFLNSPQVRTSALALADRAEREGQGDPLSRAYRLTLGRAPSIEERTAIQSFLETQTASYQAEAKPNPPRLALADACQALLASDEFVYLP